MAKKMDLIMKIQGVIDKTLPGNLKKLANEVNNLRVARQKMEHAQRSLKAQKELKKEIIDNISNYRKLKNELKTLDEIKKKNNSLTDIEKKKYDMLTKKSKALEKTITSQSKAFHKYGMELKKLKIPHDMLQHEINQTIIKEKELLAQQSIAQKVRGTAQNIKSKIKTGMKIAAVASIGAAIGIGTSSVKDYLEFDKQMIKVKALTGATAEEYDALKKKAMEVGKTTIFTSEEAAAGMEKFALAGYKSKQIIELIPPIFDLATASGEDFIMISDMISDHMSNFNLGVNDMGHVADVLANTVSNTNVNVQMISESLKYASNSAMTAGMDLETTAAAIGLMGDKALKSGRSGRYLVDALSNLKDPKIQKELKKMGVNVLDTQGKFVGFTNVIKQLDKVVDKKNLFKEQGKLSKLFGKLGSEAVLNILTAQKTINGITYEGVEAFEKFTEANRNAIGKAKEMADTIMDSDSGKWATLKSAISDVKLKIGEAIFTKSGKQLIDIAIEWLNELSNVLSGNFTDNKANKFWQSFIKNGKIFLDALVNIGTALWGIFKILNTVGIDNLLVFVTVFSMTSKAIKFGNAIFGVFKTIKAAGGIIAALKTGIAALGGPISLLIAAIVMFGYVAYKNWDKIKNLFSWLWQNLKDAAKMVYEILMIPLRDFGKLIDWVITGILNGFVWICEKISEIIQAYIELFIKFWMGIFNFIKIGFTNSWDFIKNTASKISESFIDVYDGISNIVKDIWNGVKNYVSEIVNNMIEKISEFKENFKNKVLEIAASIPGLSFVVKTKKEVDGSHRAGLDYVPYDGYIAELHKGERVLTKNENESIFDKLRNKLHNVTQSNQTTSNITTSEKSITYQITNHFSFTGVSEDTKNSVMEKIQESINELQKQLDKIKEERETYARTSL